MKNGVDVIVGFCMCALNDSAVATRSMFVSQVRISMTGESGMQAGVHNKALSNQTVKNGVDVIVGFCMCALNDSAVATRSMFVSQVRISMTGESGMQAGVITKHCQIRQ